MAKGKKNKLVDERKKVMNEIKLEFIVENDVDIPNDEDNDSDEFDENILFKQYEILNRIRNEMLLYTKDAQIPLCEYITIDDLRDFIYNISS